MKDRGSVDSAIIGFYAEAGSDESRKKLAATGAAGVERLVDLRFNPAAKPLDYALPVGFRSIRLRRSALEAVAAATPDSFLQALEGKELPPDVLGVLSEINDPRATILICNHIDLTKQDWNIRYNAIKALGRKTRDPRRGCIERALADSELVVREAAIRVLSQWDRPRAMELFQALEEELELPPLLRAKVTRAIDALRSGRELELDPIP